MIDGTGRPLLRPGETCWRIARAGRVAVIVDAANYFTTIQAAVQNARHSVHLIGWDFDTRIKLDRSGDGSKVPNRLSKFLTWVVRERPDLRVYVLRWNLVRLTRSAGTTPLVILDWMSDERIRFKLDGAHPAGSAHHQKIVVIDDALAFCGGIDMTGDRWDTRDHLDHNPERFGPRPSAGMGRGTTCRLPWTAIRRALGELARERSKHATGEELEPPPPIESAWPEGLESSFRNVDVAVSRTAPEYDGRSGVHEIEALYLAAIAAAERTIYIESQYFASRKIAEAMADRLGEADGPAIVVVNPESAQGWLEEEVMGSSRARLLRLVRKADGNDRFRLYTGDGRRAADLRPCEGHGRQ